VEMAYLNENIAGTAMAASYQSQVSERSLSLTPCKLVLHTHTHCIRVSMGYLSGR
jgi:hypothetical protein